MTRIMTGTSFYGGDIADMVDTSGSGADGLVDIVVNIMLDVDRYEDVVLHMMPNVAVAYRDRHI